MTAPKLRPPLATGLLLALLLAACGDSATSGSPAPDATPGTAASSAAPSVAETTAPASPVVAPSSAPPTDLVPPPPTKGGGKKSSATTIQGVVVPGVEQGCLLLDGYLLLGGPRDVLRAGRRVVVTGHVATGVMTTCQQGKPFAVVSARAGS